MTRFVYNTVHLGSNIDALAGVSGDTNFTYQQLLNEGYVTTQVKVRISVPASSTYQTGYYSPGYVETSPTNVQFPTFSFGSLYYLDINNPYITVIFFSFGGTTQFFIETGRVDEQAYAATFALMIRDTFLLIAFAFAFLQVLL